MINIVITAYGEPKATKKAVDIFLKENIKDDFNITVVDPFPETRDFIKENFKDNKRVRFFLDPGEGKSYALNLLLTEMYSENKNDIFIFSDGDVFIEKGSVSALLEKLKDLRVGVVCGRPVAVDDRNTKYGYWAHLLLDGANNARKKLVKRGFMEVSGYLFAMRNGVVKEFPISSSEDSTIPFYFWKNNYKIDYSEKAKVNVLSPGNYKEWVNQKKRNIKGHMALEKTIEIEDRPPRTKTFFNEVVYGLGFSLSYSRSLKEFFWTLNLYFARLHVWWLAFKEIKIKKKEYKDGWRENPTESTKMLD